jgi:hypothetical protein
LGSKVADEDWEPPEHEAKLASKTERQQAFRICVIPGLEEGIGFVMFIVSCID